MEKDGCKKRKHMWFLSSCNLQSNEKIDSTLTRPFLFVCLLCSFFLTSWLLDSGVLQNSVPELRLSVYMMLLADLSHSMAVNTIHTIMTPKFKSPISSSPLTPRCLPNNSTWKPPQTRGLKLDSCSPTICSFPLNSRPAPLQSSPSNTTTTLSSQLSPQNRHQPDVFPSLTLYSAVSIFHLPYLRPDPKFGYLSHIIPAQIIIIFACIIAITS